MFTLLSFLRARGCSPLWQRFARPLLLLFCFTLSTLSSMADPFEIKIGRATYWCDDDGTAIVLAWENHERIKTVTLPAAITADEKSYRVTGIGKKAFFDCKNLTSVSLPENLTFIEDDAFKNCTGLISINLPAGLKEIGKSVFERCRSLISISLPENLPTIKENLFLDCRGLTSVSLPNGLTAIERRAFEGCTGLISISLPAGLATIGEYAFSSCTGLTSISLPEGLATIGGSAFSGCSGLTSVSLPERLTEIGAGVFYNCSGLTSISLPDGLTTIGGSAFRGCTGLTSVSLPDALTAIGEYGFSDCSGLTSVSLPEELTMIEKYTFSGCSSLTNVHFPQNLRRIRDYAFANCPNLTTLYFEGVIAPNIVGHKDDNYHNIKVAQVYVPIDAIEYKTGWGGKPIELIKELPIQTKILDHLDSYIFPKRVAAPITYTRRFTDTDWQPLYVPFALTKQDLGDTLEVAVLNDEQPSNEVIHFHHLQDGETLPAWSIALIRAKRTGKHVISLANAPLAARENRTVSAGNYVFYGNLYKQGFFSDEKAYLMERDGCHRLNNSDKKIGALRWYMSPTATVPDTVRILVDGVPTAIEGIHVDDTTAPCYDLSGRRLEAAPEHGVYIQNGRKKIR